MVGPSGHLPNKPRRGLAAAGGKCLSVGVGRRRRGAGGGPNRAAVGVDARPECVSSGPQKRPMSQCRRERRAFLYIYFLITGGRPTCERSSRAGGDPNIRHAGRRAWYGRPSGSADGQAARPPAAPSKIQDDQAGGGRQPERGRQIGSACGRKAIMPCRPACRRPGGGRQEGGRRPPPAGGREHLFGAGLNSIYIKRETL